MSKTATEVRKLSGFTGDARLFRLSEPMGWSAWDSDSESYVSSMTDHVIVSATTVMFSGPETYIFPASEAGEIVNWGKLDGSVKGCLDHAEALRGAGYEVA